MTDDNVIDNGDGMTGNDLDDDGDDIDDDCEGVTGNEVDDNGDLAKVLLLSMHRPLRRRRDSVAALVMMALLSSQMRRPMISTTRRTLPSLRWRCCPHCDGIIAVADAQASCHCQR